MTPRDPQIRRLTEAAKSARTIKTDIDRAWERYGNGTLTDADLDIIGFDEKEEDVWRLIGLTRPFKQVRDVGYSIPRRTKLTDVLGLLLSYGPDETPEEYLVKVVRDWREPRKTDDQDRVDWHNLMVAARRIMGADDGLPFRQAIANGDWDPPYGKSLPHPGYAFCPLDCTNIGGRVDPGVCYCCKSSRPFPYRADVPATFVPWTPVIPPRTARAARTGQPRPDEDDPPAELSGGGQPEPERPQGPSGGSAPVPYSEPPRDDLPPRRTNPNRVQVIGSPIRPSRGRR